MGRNSARKVSFLGLTVLLIPTFPFPPSLLQICRLERLASEEHECSFLLTDGALAEWVALQELVLEVVKRERVEDLVTWLLF